MTMTTNTDPVRAHDELRVQAALLRTREFMAQFDPEKFARQLERIAAALASAPPSGGVLGYVRRAAIENLRAHDEATWVMVHADPPADSVPVYLPSAIAEEYTRGRCDGWEAAKAAAPSAPVGVDDALVAGAMEAAADACQRHVVCNEAITAALEYALTQQPASAGKDGRHYAIEAVRAESFGLGAKTEKN